MKAQSLGNLSDICFLVNESSGKVNQIKVATAQTKSARGKRLQDEKIQQNTDMLANKFK